MSSPHPPVAGGIVPPQVLEDGDYGMKVKSHEELSTPPPFDAKLKTEIYGRKPRIDLCENENEPLRDPILGENESLKVEPMRSVNSNTLQKMKQIDG